MQFASSNKGGGGGEQSAFGVRQVLTPGAGSSHTDKAF